MLDQTKFLGNHFESGFAMKCLLKLRFLTFCLFKHFLYDLSKRLTLRDVDLVDAGNYTCQPAALPEATVTLHVVKPETVEIMEVTSAAESCMSLTALSLCSFMFYFL